MSDIDKLTEAEQEEFRRLSERYETLTEEENARLDALFDKTLTPEEREELEKLERGELKG